MEHALVEQLNTSPQDSTDTSFAIATPLLDEYMGYLLALASHSSRLYSYEANGE
jgi:hypothetical protein